MAFLYIKPFALLHCVSAEMGQSLCGEEANFASHHATPRLLSLIRSAAWRRSGISYLPPPRVNGLAPGN